MLGSRTKVISSYGKRGRRVVGATTDNTNSNLGVSGLEIISIFDDLSPPPELSSLKNKMKKRENIVPMKTKPAAPVKVVGLQKKRRLSPVLSPPKKKQNSRITQIISDEGCKSIPALPTTKKAKPTPLSLGNPEDAADSVSASPPRAPLSAVRLNVPGSPAVPQSRRFATGKTPLKSKAFSPFVDVDIIVLDDGGRTIHTEKRVNQDRAKSSSLKQAQPVKSSIKPKRPIATSIETDNESESDNLPRPPRHRVVRKPTIVLSDDEDSDEYVPTPVPKKKVASQPDAPPKSSTVSSSSTKLGRTGSKLILEVVIPPAPYKLPSAHPIPTTPSPPSPPSPIHSVQQEIAPVIPYSGTQEVVPQRYQTIPSPILKPRQLTPIRGGRKRLFEPISPPSPTTPTDFDDLSLDFSELILDSSDQAQGTCQNDLDVPEYLLPLLEECHQQTCGIHNFSNFIESFPRDPILQSARNAEGADMRFRKIGEASYSEVFGIGDVVLKIIPLRDEAHPHGLDLEEDDGPAPSDAKDVRKEIIVTRAMGEVYGAYVKLLKTYVVRGRYPEVLLQLWDEYNVRKGSESVRPDTFKLSQVYAIIVLPNGGPDLEAYTFQHASRTGWRQASSLFWQVAKALAHAEHLVSFEHRDLHWGQILVKNVPTQNNALKSLNSNQKPKSKAQRVCMDDLSHGVQATLIDLGLSRMDAGDGGNGDRVHWTPFDDEVFMGEGDYQFDVYRMMKEMTGGIWDGYHSITNVLWLHYLLQKLLNSKGLKPPSAPRKKASSETSHVPPSEAAFSEKDCYECLVDIENWLGQTIASIAPRNPVPMTKRKGGRKTQILAKASVYSGPMRAGEIVAYGVKREWIKPTRLY